MKSDRKLSPDVIYEMVAKVGFRKHFHLGGFEATRELVELCQIDRNEHVLDIGCGSGRTACYIAKRYGCRVGGVDLLQGMVDRANERARREGVQDTVEFQVGDAQELPFENELFDVVIGEFITGLLEDKHRGVKEYLRVVKPGGTIGLNEATWVKTPPPTELGEYLSKGFGVRGEILDSDGWRELLEGAGLRNIIVRTNKVDALSNKTDDMTDLLRTLPMLLYMYVRSSMFRRFIQESLSIPKNLLEYFGYGLYVGRK